MYNFASSQQTSSKDFLGLFFLFLALLILPPSVVLADSHPCENAVTQLKGDLGVVMNRGGLWSLMEQRGLQDNSVLGMQADSKLARAVGQFETLCEGGKKPAKQLFDAIQNIVGEARVIFNPRTSGKKIKQSIVTLNKKLDALLLKIK